MIVATTVTATRAEVMPTVIANITSTIVIIEA
jgi:hypothetical protein